MTYRLHMDPTISDPPGTLAEQIESSLEDVRSALGALFEALSDIRRPTDLQRRLNIDPALAWGVYRVATSASAMLSGRHVPGSGAFRTFVRAVNAAGVDAELVAEVTRAFERFDKIRESNGGLQNGFVTLINDLAEDDEPREALKQRRAAFRANGHIWGLQAGTFTNCKILIPSKQGGIDLVSVQGVTALKKLRRMVSYRVKFVSFSLQRTGQAISRGAESDGYIPLTLDQDAPSDEYAGTGLLTDFCSRPLPEWSPSESDKSWTGLVRHRDVGVGGAATVYVGYRQNNYYTSPKRLSDGLDLSTYTRIPGELLVYDALVHSSLAQAIQPRIRLYGRRTGTPDHFVYQDDDQLPMEEEIVTFDRADRATRLPDLPRHAELLRRVCETTGYPVESFRLARAMVKYPVLNAYFRYTIRGV